MNTDIRKRFFEEFIEAVKSNTDCSEDDYMNYVMYEFGPGTRTNWYGMPMDEDEDEVRAFANLGLDLSAEDFDTALEGVRRHVSGLLNVSGLPGDTIVPNLVTKIVTDTRAGLRMRANGLDMWRQWTDSAADRAEMVARIAEARIADEAALARVRARALHRTRARG
jgi:hypothetical protein